MTLKHLMVFATCIPLASACTQTSKIGTPPEFTPMSNSVEAQAITLPVATPLLRQETDFQNPSLWNNGRTSLLGDRRAEANGDILTVVIEIDEGAEISNASSRNRSGSEDLSVPSFFGVPDIASRILPSDATLDPAVGTRSQSQFSGDGSVRRSESLELRIAATVTETLASGALKIMGSQEVRVNNELRELLVTGFVRPEDISRRNEITYDKIASARISYGGRGLISSAQTPRRGQAISDAILPF